MKIPHEYFLLSTLECIVLTSQQSHVGYYVCYESSPVSHKGCDSYLQTLSVYDMKVSQLNDYKLMAKKLADSARVTYHLHSYAYFLSMD